VTDENHRIGSSVMRRRLAALALMTTAQAVRPSRTITVRGPRDPARCFRWWRCRCSALTDPARTSGRAGPGAVLGRTAVGGRQPRLDVIFNVTIGPSERQSYRLEYGEQVAAAPPRGMTVTEDADGIQAGNLKFNKQAGSLVLSANYRGEFVGQGANGLSIVDADGRRHAAGDSGPRALIRGEAPGGHR
jgi:hypothetical protein